MNRLISTDRLRRVLGRPGTPGLLSAGVKTAVFFIVVVLLVALIAWVDPRPSLRHVKVSMLSGTPSGNYHATVDKLGAEVARRGGRVLNLASAGAVENVQRLVDGAKDCKVDFALVQDGVILPAGDKLEQLGRLPRKESLVVLGRGTHALRVPADLRGLRLGIGPIGSGTEQVMRRILLHVSSLDLAVSTQSFDAQLDMLERGQLDLAAMIIDDGAQLLADAVTKRKLEIVQLPDVASLGHRLPFARVGMIEAGQIDYVHNLPRQDIEVLQVDTLIVGNGCASNGATQGLLTAVSKSFPTFLHYNRNTGDFGGLPMATVAENFINGGGPDLLGRYAPWAVDIMPLPTWIQLGVALSLLFSGMATWHRFRLWRVDASRVKIEREIAALLAPGAGAHHIAEIRRNVPQTGPEVQARVEECLVRLSALSERCRRQSVSILVPMGAEMAYRYQEKLIAELLDALRHARDRPAR
jgi:hypothetical protein